MRLLLALLLLIAPLPAAAQAFPELTGRVVDQADLLPPQAEAELTERLAALERRTTDQLVIVTVDSLHGRAIAGYTRDLGNHWGIGTAEKDNGVILLVAPHERRVRIAVGYGLEHVLTDEEADEIVERDLLPCFREADWYGGIDAGSRSIAARLSADDAMTRGREN